MESKNAGKLHIYKKVDETKTLIFSFDLQTGITTVGRLSKSKPSDIEIPDDDYMSHQHFIIEIFRDLNSNQWCYTLYDNHSRNGTFFRDATTHNQNRLKKDKRIFVTKGDEIRAGRTYFQIEPAEEI